MILSCFGHLPSLSVAWFAHCTRNQHTLSSQSAVETSSRTVAQYSTQQRGCPQLCTQKNEVNKCWLHAWEWGGIPHQPGAWFMISLLQFMPGRDGICLPLKLQISLTTTCNIIYRIVFFCLLEVFTFGRPVWPMTIRVWHPWSLSPDQGGGNTVVQTIGHLHVFAKCNDDQQHKLGNEDGCLTAIIMYMIEVSKKSWCIYIITLNVLSLHITMHITAFTMHSSY